ncbi:hypothetical protein IG631_15691 [Alternaria alternata]|nr:hypothetical protein IG631_15691 [Alternaria alternata]
MIVAYQDTLVHRAIARTIAERFKEITALHRDNVIPETIPAEGTQNLTPALFSRARQNQWRLDKGSPASRVQSCGHVDRLNRCKHAHRIKYCRCSHTDCAWCLTSQRTTAMVSASPSFTGSESDAPQQDQDAVDLPFGSPHISLKINLLQSGDEPQVIVSEAPAPTSTFSIQSSNQSSKMIPLRSKNVQPVEELGDGRAGYSGLELSASRKEVRQSPQIQHTRVSQYRSKRFKQHKKERTSTSPQHQPTMPLLQIYQYIGQESGSS